MSKNVVFDFDNTLTTFDTIYPFLLFCCDDILFIQIIKKILWIVIKIIYKARLISNDNLKEIGIFMYLKKKEKVVIEKKAKRFFRTISYHPKVLNKLKYHLEVGDNVYISSASFAEYLNEFMKKYKVIKLNCSLLEYEFEKVQGLHYNNYGNKKLLFFNENNISIDVLYTDSLDDRFLAEEATIINIVDRNGSLLENLSYESFLDSFN